MNSSKNTKKGTDNKLKPYMLDLLQAKSYRVMKAASNKALEDHNISATDWSILGALKSSGKPLLFGELARKIGVTAPRITTVIGDLTSKNWIQIETDPTDNRRKFISLSKEGQKFLSATERLVNREIQKLFEGISDRDMAGYVKVLEHITKEEE